MLANVHECHSEERGIFPQFLCIISIVSTIPIST